MGDWVNNTEQPKKSSFLVFVNYYFSKAFPLRKLLSQVKQIALLPSNQVKDTHSFLSLVEIYPNMGPRQLINARKWTVLQ